jgi:O-antigen/teichoic acid export membrane protein
LTRHFKKNVLILTGGTAVSQALGIAASVVLARIYSPDHFGVLALLSSAVGFFSIAASGRYELGFMLAEKHSVIRSLFRLIVRIVVVVSLICAAGSLGYFYFAEPEDLRRTPFLMLGPAVFAASSAQVINVFLTREKQFKSLSVIRIVEVSANVIPALFLGSLGATGLVSAYLISQVVLAIGLTLIMMQVWKKKYQSEKKTDIPSLAEVAGKFQQFPRYNVSQGLLDAFQMSGILWIGASFLSLTAMGFYGIVMRFLQIPFGLIIRPLAQVYFGEIAEAFRQKKPFYEFSKKLAIRIAFLALPVLIIFPFMAEFIFETLLGSKWRGAGPLASILAFWIVADSIRSPLSQIPIILSVQAGYLKITLTGTLILFTIFFLICSGMPGENYINVFLIFTCIQVLFNMYLIFHCLQLARKHDAGLHTT